MLFDKKVFVTGGSFQDKAYRSTEIIDIGENGDLNIRKGDDLNVARKNHGMGIVTIDNRPTLISIGGDTGDIGVDKLKSIEIWNSTSESWNISSNLMLKNVRAYFSFATFPTEFLCRRKK